MFGVTSKIREICHSIRTFVVWRHTLDIPQCQHALAACSSMQWERAGLWWPHFMEYKLNLLRGFIPYNRLSQMIPGRFALWHVKTCCSFLTSPLSR